MRGVKRVFVAALAVVLLLPVRGVATPTEAQRLGEQLRQLQSRVRTANGDYDRAYWRLDETDVRLEKLDARQKRTAARLKRVRRRLAARARSIYRSGSASFLEVLLGANSFDEMLDGLDFFQRIGTADASQIAEAERLSAELQRTRRQLVAERKRRAGDVAQLRRQRDALSDRFAAVQGEYAQLQQRLKDAVAREIADTGRSSYSAPRGPLGMVFPVQGPHSYSDSWGASRSGGRRRHKGTDIMSPRGTPCVAVLSGSVHAKENSLGGKTIWLTADNGWEFYYAHLDSWVVTSGHVRAGQVIGRVGDTGNARGGAPHLHFQIHPNGGGPVNPYPYLRQME